MGLSPGLPQAGCCRIRAAMASPTRACRPSHLDPTASDLPDTSVIGDTKEGESAGLSPTTGIGAQQL